MLLCFPHNHSLIVVYSLTDLSPRVVFRSLFFNILLNIMLKIYLLYSVAKQILCICMLKLSCLWKIIERTQKLKSKKNCLMGAFYSFAISSMGFYKILIVEKIWRIGKSEKQNDFFSVFYKRIFRQHKKNVNCWKIEF